MKFIIKKIKKIQLFLLLFCLTAGMGVIHAQGVYRPPSDGVAVLRTQADVDTLGMDLGTNTIIAGNISIQEATDTEDPITDLSIFKHI